MPEEEAEQPDVEALVQQIRARVAERYAAGEYPPDLERDLEDHFEQLAGAAGTPARFARLIRDLDEAAAFTTERISLDSSLPAGRRLHGLIAQLVDRQTSGILQQNREFAQAVRRLLVEVVASLPDAPAPVPAWDVPHDYQEQLYGPRSEVVARMAAVAGALAGAEPVLVLETGRGELLDALASAGLRTLESRGDPLQQLQWLPDGGLGGLALRRVVERLPPRQVGELARLAARRLAPGGRLAVVGIEPGRRQDPALPHPLDAGYLQFAVHEAGFSAVSATSLGDGQYLLTARL